MVGLRLHPIRHEVIELRQLGVEEADIEVGERESPVKYPCRWAVEVAALITTVDAIVRELNEVVEEVEKGALYEAPLAP